MKQYMSPPGTLNYTGVYTDEPLELDLIAYDRDHYERKTIHALKDLRHEAKCKWLNITGLNDIEIFKDLHRQYGIDLLALEDVVQVSQRSKIEVFSEHSLSIFKMVKVQADGKLLIEHLSLLMLPAEKLIITFQETQGDVFWDIRKRMETATGQVRFKGIDYLYYALMDAIIDHQTEAFYHLQLQIDNLEKEVFDRQKSLESLYSLRRDLLNLKTACQPLGDMIEAIMRENSKIVSLEVTHYFKDALDHQIHLMNQISNYREIISNIYDLYQSSLNNDMNQIMKMLTIFSAIFIPLSFLTGFFGMNFKDFPVLNVVGGVHFFVLGCLTIAVAMLLWFKHKDWL